MGLESIVNTVLVKALGEYIENLDQNAVQISLLNGNVNLRQLKLKRSALDQFNLPFFVSVGMIDSLSASIPWKHLQSQSVVIKISDIFFIVKPKKVDQWDEESENLKKKKILEKKIATYESTKAKELEKQQQTTTTEKKGFLSYFVDTDFMKKLAETVLNNLQITIENVHFRYEDTSDSSNPIIFGVTLKELSLRSCDANWIPTFVTQVQDTVYKKADLKNLAIYFNESGKSIPPNMPIDDFILEMKKGIDHSAHHFYVLHPVSGTFKAKIQRQLSNMNEPRITGEIVFDDFSIMLNDLHYKNILQTVHYIMNYKQLDELRSRRPLMKPRTKESRLLWFKYLSFALQKQSQEQYFSWNDAVQRKKQQQEYIVLYKKYKEVPWLEKMTVEERNQFETIQAKFDFEDVVFFRELADAEISKESIKYKEYQEKLKQQQAAAKSSSGWFGWLRSSSSTSQLSTAEQDSISMEENARKELYKAIGYEANQVAQNTLPSDFQEFKISFVLKKASATLVDHQQKSKIVGLEFFNLGANGTLFQNNSFEAAVQLEDFIVHDMTFKQSSFPKLVYKRPEQQQQQSLDLRFKTNPKEGIDFGVQLIVNGVNVVVNPLLLQKIIGFFAIPKNTIDTSTLEDIAKNSLSTFQQKATTQLKIALETKKVVDVVVSVQAPIFLIPEQITCTDASSLVIIDLGTLQVKSMSDASERKKRLESQQLEVADFYDRYNLHLQDIQVVTSTYGQWKASSHFTDDNYLLEKVDFDLGFEHLIVDTNEFAKLKFQGVIPSITIRMDPNKLNSVLTIYKSFIPLIQDPTGLSSKSTTLFSSSLKVKLPNQEKEDTFLVSIKENGMLEIVNPKKSVSILLNNIKFKELDYGFSIIVNEFKDQNELKEQEFVFREEDLTQRKEWIKNIQSISAFLKAESVKKGKYQNIAQGNALETNETTNTTSTELSPNSHYASVSFLLGNFSLWISTRNSALSEIKMQKLQVGLDAKSNDLQLKLSIHTISISDLSPQLILSSSKKYILFSNIEADTDLVTLSLIRASENSPIYDPEAGTVCKIGLRRVHFYFDREYLIRLVRLIYECIDVLKIIRSNDRVVFISAPPDASETHESTAAQLTKRAASELTKTAFQLIANLENAKLSLVENMQPFVSLELSDARFGLLIRNDKLLVETTIRNFEVSDHDKETKYKTVLSSQDKNRSLFYLQYLQPKTELNSEDQFYYGQFLKIEMTCVKAVYLHRLIRKIISFFSETDLWKTISGKVSAETVQQMASKATSTASAAISNDKTSRISISLCFDQPTVVLPIHHTSHDKFVGSIRQIQFNSSLIQQQKNNDYPPLEEYHIALKEMNLFSVSDRTIVPMIDKQTANVSITITNALKENLLVCPNFKLHVHVASIHLHMTHEQYLSIFDLIKYNFSTPSAPTSANTKENSTSRIKSALATYEALRNQWAKGKQMTDTMNTVILSPQNKHKSLHTAFVDGIVKSQFVVSFDSIQLTIGRQNGAYKGMIDDIASLDISKLQVDYKDEHACSLCKVQVASVSACDLRMESSSVFKEFISCGSLINPDDEFLRFIYTKQLHTNSTAMELFFSSEFRVYLDVILIKEISSFFSNNSRRRLELEQQTPIEKQKVEFSTPSSVSTPAENSKDASLDEAFGTQVLSPSSEQSSTVADEQEEEEKSTQTFHFRLQCKYAPCIVLPEKIDKLDCKLFTFSARLSVDLIYDTKEKLMISLSDINAYFENALSRKRSAPLVDELGVLVNWTGVNVSSEIMQRTVGVKLTHSAEDVKLRASFKNFKMIQQVINEFKEQSAKTPDQINQIKDQVYAVKGTPMTFEKEDLVEKSLVILNEDDEEDFDDDNKNASDDSFKSGTEEDEIPDEEDKNQIEEDDDDSSLMTTDTTTTSTAVEQVKPQTVVTWLITVNILKPVQLQIVDDLRGMDIPLLLMRCHYIDLEETINQHTLSICGSIQLSVEIFYFNRQFGEYEPLLEQCIVDVENARLPIVNRSHELFHLDATIKTGPLLLNISKQMIDTVNEIVKQWSDTETVQMENSQLFAPFLINNQSGMECKVTRLDNYQLLILQNGQSITLQESKQKTGLHNYILSKFAVQLQLPQFRPCTVNLNSQQSVVPLYPKQPDASTICFVHSKLEHGTRIFTLSSAFTVQNNTNRSWKIGLYSRNQVKELCTLQPGEMFGLPILSSLQQEHLCIKPIEEDVSWSDVPLATNLLQISKSDRNHSRLFTCKSLTSQDVFCVGKCIIERVPPNHKMILIQLQTPLCLENLLPKPIQVEWILQDKVVQVCTVESGNQIQVFSCNVSNDILMRLKYENRISQSNASIHCPLSSRPSDYYNVLVNSQESPIIVMMDMLSNHDTSYKHVTLYSQYWIYNSSHSMLTCKPVRSSNTILSIPPFKTNALSPVLYSHTNHQMEHEKIILGSNNNSPLSLDAIGVDQYLELNVKQWSVHVQLGPGPFKRTKIVTLQPKYKLINQTKTLLYVKQHQHTTNQVAVSSKQEEEFHFAEYQSKEQQQQTEWISVSLDDFSWSVPCKVNALGECYIKCGSVILQVVIQVEHGMICIILREPESVPFAIKNGTHFSIQIIQHGSKMSKWQTISPFARLPYLLDDYQTEPLIDIALLHNNQQQIILKKFPLGQLGKVEYIKLKDFQCKIHCKAKGATRVVRIEQLNQDPTASFMEKKKEDVQVMDITLQIEKIGISLVVHHNDIAQQEQQKFNFSEEIIYLEMAELQLLFLQTLKHQLVKFQIMTIQIDNMGQNILYPIVLRKGDNALQDEPVLVIAIDRLLKDSKGNVIALQEFEVLMQSISCSIEYALIKKVALFFEKSISSLSNKDQISRKQSVISLQQLETLIMPPLSTSLSSLNKERIFFFQKLLINSISINVTFSLNELISNKNNSKQQNNTSDNPLFLLLNNLGFTVVSIDNAPIRINSLLLQYPFVTQSELIAKLKQHILMNLIKQSYRIIGSFDAIGNPVGLIYDLGTGFKDFFIEPADALLKADFNQMFSNIAKGTKSITLKTIHGTANTTSKISSTIHKGLAGLTMDEDYISKTKTKQGKKAQSLEEGIKTGAESVAKGMAEGIGGIFTKPIEGAKQEGFGGFLKGIGKGLIGVPLKPIAGVVEAVQKTTEGIASIDTKKVNQRRLPRAFREDGLLIPYDPLLARIQQHLQTNFKGEILQFYCNNGTTAGEFVLLTSNCVICANLANNKTLWCIPYIYLSITGGKNNVLLLMNKSSKNAQEYYVKPTAADGKADLQKLQIIEEKLMDIYVSVQQQLYKNPLQGGNRSFLSSRSSITGCNE